MRTLVSTMFVCVVVVGTLASPPHRSKRWTVRSPMSEPAPGVTGRDLMDVLSSAPDIRYSDWTKKLTAIKDSKFKACFIVDLDPQFYLLEPEMDQITNEKKPDLINSPPAYYTFLEKAGPMITAMCQYMDNYWLNAVAPPIPVGNNPPSDLPEPIHVRVPDSPVNHQPMTPPPVAIYRQQQESRAVQTPPPVDVYHQALANENVPQQERLLKTPPPVEVYHQQQQALSNQNSEVVAGTPPPMDVYRPPQALANEDSPQRGGVAGTPPPVMTPPPLAQWRLQHPN